MNGDSKQVWDGQAFLGFLIVCGIAMIAAYCLEIAGECLRNNVAAVNSEHLFEERPVWLRIAISVGLAAILYGALWAFHHFCNWIGLKRFQFAAVVIGVVASGFIPIPDILCDICHCNPGN